MKNVTIYTTPTCGYCVAVKGFLKEHKVPFSEKDVARDPAARQEMVEKSHQMGVPVVDIGGDIVVGFDHPRIAALLELY